jgi:membrane-associated phospholipid phosphatase
VILIDQVDPLTPDEIARLDVNDINEFDRNGMEPYRDGAAGDITAAATYLLPLALLANDETRRDWQIVGVMWVEATLLNLGVDGVVKPLVRRTRPYAYDPDAPGAKQTERSARLSFYSGHTTGAAMNCFFVARVASDYLDDRRAEAVIWVGAAVIPAVVGALRVDSGHHFRTDAIAGYAAGAAIGWLVPVLHRRPADRVSLLPGAVGGGAGLVATVRF